MKPTTINRIRLWWHCVTHLHREGNTYSTNKQLDKMTFSLIGDLISIQCMDCDYGGLNNG